MEENYESNSWAKKTQPKEEPEKKPVIMGKATQKKKSAGRQFVETFVNEDADTIKSHVVFDIIVPYIKDMISAGFHAALDMLLYGNGGGPVRSSNGRRIVSSSSRTDYNAVSKQKQNYATRKTQICDDIAFENRGDAEAVLDEMNDIIDKYSQVSAYDYYEAAGITCDYTLKNWGWYDLTGAIVKMTRDGDYIISMPKCILLK